MTISKKKPTIFTLSIRNYRGLKSVAWSPAGVCALVGPNGSGKTTLLEAIDLLRDALASGLERALENGGGLAAVRFFGAKSDEDIDLGLEVEGGKWTLRPSLLDAAACEPVRDLIRGFRAYGHYDLAGLRRGGSPMSDDSRMDRAGRNVFSVLRGWRDRAVDRHRCDFVSSSLAKIFPDFHAAIVVEQAQTVAAQVRIKPFDKLVPLSLVPDGWLVALLNLCAIASTDPRDVISIDEPELALHPGAIRRLVDVFHEWSEIHGVTVIFETHSPVLLDTLKDRPDHVFVMQPGADSLPVPLDKLRTPNWLSHFALGDLYAHGEYGAPMERSAR